MAIPFNIPSDSEPQEHSSTDERLDQLLQDLYHLLRQILLRPHCDYETDSLPAPSLSRQTSSDVTRPAVPVASSQTTACSCLCPCASRRRPPRRHRSCRRPCTTIVRRKEEEWLVIGEQLRKFAEEFKATMSRKEVPEEQSVVPLPSLRTEEKTPSLFSLLLPGHFRSSMWTTVILLVGWRLLSRSR